ncbi:MAG: ABC transporter ATP-binding protein [Halobacteria archaeon]|nr:ABC transporter ATP-binding protein [Halobacteria archaeon]
MQVVAEDVSKSYGGTTALDGVSLEVDEGEVFSLVGPNGAGKTTLVRCLTGVAEPDSGEVGLLGSPPSETDMSRVGLLPQNFTPPERLTPRELVGYYADLYDVARDVDEVIDEVGLREASGKRYSSLSGGQKRRLCVATALVNDPDVLFLDEPTTGIDPEGRRSLWGLIEESAEQGTTTFLTTHYMEEAERLSDRVGLLVDGELVETGEPTRLVEEFGGEASLAVEIRGEAPSTEGLSEAVEGGFSVTKESGELVFEGVDADSIGRVIDALNERGVEYESVVWRQPSLEDVYLRLTGGSLSAEVGDVTEVSDGGS